MLSWAAKRRLVYIGGVLFVLALIGSVIFFKLLYHAPTCSDGLKNGDEIGIDCGGSCKSLCATDTLTPVVLWSKIFNISGDVYSAVAYVENPNVNYKNESVGYEFRILDNDNKLILVKDGETSIPKNKKFAIFETGIVIRNTKPKSAEFQFTSFSKWQSDTEQEPKLSVKYSTLMSTSTSPRIEGTVSNNSLTSVLGLELDVFVLDNKENVIAASRTFLENLLARSQQDFVFTWPKPFNLGVEACANPLDVVLALDKSGSMKSESINPLEPFSTVKSTAIDFIKNINNGDQISIVSFGTNGFKDSGLSFDKDTAVKVVSGLSLSTTTEQTNIGDGISIALEELTSKSVRENSSKMLILLTDGIPTEPTKVNEPNYPIEYAKSMFKRAKNAGITVYTIGLGKNVSEEFLKSISTSDAHYFLSPTKDTLKDIYSKISNNMCPKKPNVITVMYRVL